MRHSSETEQIHAYYMQRSWFISNNRRKKKENRRKNISQSRRLLILLSSSDKGSTQSQMGSQTEMFTCKTGPGVLLLSIMGAGMVLFRKMKCHKKQNQSRQMQDFSINGNIIKL